MKAQPIPKEQQSGPLFEPPKKPKPDRFACAPRSDKVCMHRVSRYAKACSVSKLKDGGWTE